MLLWGQTRVFIQVKLGRYIIEDCMNRKLFITIEHNKEKLSINLPLQKALNTHIFPFSQEGLCVVVIRFEIIRINAYDL